MLTTRTIFVAASALVIGLSATSARAQQADTCGPPAEMSAITVMGDWLPWSSQGPIIAAQEKGYYKAEGFTVRLIAPAQVADPIKLVARERAHFAMSYVPEVMNARDTGIPVVSVGIILYPYAQGMMIPPESGIKTVADLKGKNIAIGPLPASQAAFATMLETGGLTKEDVNMVDPGFGVVQLVVEGKVDTGHGLVYGEPAAVNAKRKEQGKPPVDFWLYSDYGVPNFYFMMFVANENWIERNSATTCRFLRATKKGYAEFEQNRDVYNKIFAKRNEVFTLADHSSFTDVTLPDWKGPNGKFYEQEASVWKAAMDWALKAKLITVGDEPANYFTNKYLPN